MGYRISIGLLGKGSTNHLHRQEVVDAFRDKGITVDYIVRSDYISLLHRLDGCSYSAVRFKEPLGLTSHILNICGFIRNLYPAWDPGRHEVLHRTRSASLVSRLWQRICLLFARYRTFEKWVVKLEKRLFEPTKIEGLKPETINQMLLLGIGTVNSELEGQMTLWARTNRIPVVHLIGNYDNLTSKGFRGVDVDRLFVWGPSMREDAIRFHDIPDDRITNIGSLRYNAFPSILNPDKEYFFKTLGLDPAKKTILFAGFVFPFHYFEMLSIYDELVRDGLDCQLILRIYPNKSLMNSVYLKPIFRYAESLKRVYVSVGDPHYKSGEENREVLQIEEYELANCLNCCNLVINIFSTISIEACMFDKPALNMWYFPTQNKALKSGPVYMDYTRLFHNRRMSAYGVVPTATDRESLIRMIVHALSNPDAMVGRRRSVVQNEIGILDGKASHRLVEACIKEYGV